MAYCFFDELEILLSIEIHGVKLVEIFELNCFTLLIQYTVCEKQNKTHSSLPRPWDLDRTLASAFSHRYP